MQTDLVSNTRILVAYPVDREETDALAAHSDLLTSALREIPGVQAVRANPADVTTRDAGTALLQYNPFSYGRWGVAPLIVAWGVSRRLRGRHLRLVLVVHEPYVGVEGPRTFLMAAAQRVQLAAVRLAAHAVVAPSADAARRCGTWMRRASVVPVGSNLPDRPGAREAMRRELSADRDTVVLTVFGRSMAGRSLAHVEAALAAVAATGRPTSLLVLGAGHGVPSSIPAGVEIHAPGALPAADVAALMSAGDIFLAPYVDGVSTRRGALMAALQHGLSVVGTDAGRSDRILLDCRAIQTVAVEDVRGFAGLAAALSEDSEERRRRGAAARELYESHFAWDVIARQLLEQVVSRRT